MNDLDNKVDQWDHDNLQQQVWELDRQLKDLSERLEKLERKDIPLPIYPAPDLYGGIKCSKCGLVWSGTMGYVCSDSQCPIQPTVTC